MIQNIYEIIIFTVQFPSTAFISVPFYIIYYVLTKYLANLVTSLSESCMTVSSIESISPNSQYSNMMFQIYIKITIFNAIDNNCHDLLYLYISYILDRYMSVTPYTYTVLSLYHIVTSFYVLSNFWNHLSYVLYFQLFRRQLVYIPSFGYDTHLEGN